MKRFFILFVGLMICLGGAAFAAESVLIDFSELTPNWPADDPTDNEETLIDVSAEVAGTLYTEEQLQQMRTSLAIEKWEIELNSSSRFVETQRLSEVRQAQVNPDATRFAEEFVLGARVNFPDEPYNGWALIQPPFEIPAYANPTQVQDGDVVEAEGEPGSKFDNRGVVKNVGTLRSVALNVYGLNFPHGVSLILQDENNEEEEIFMGYLDFEGWRTMVWENPNYLEEVRDREIRTFPLYPNLQPMRKLIGIRIYRDAAMPGGDFITYVKDVQMKYDQAVLDVQRDINDEEVWGILQERERERREAEFRRLGNLQVLRYLEDQRMDESEDPTEFGGTEENGDQQQNGQQQ
jgi:hypothetical protein